MWNLDEDLKGEPLYVRIYQQIKKMIHEKKYVEDEKLPSKRKLSQTLKVSPMTVDLAYQQLIAEGYVYSVEKSGYFVASQVDFALIKPKDQEKEEPVYKKEETFRYEFRTNVVDTSLFPYATWSKLARKVLSDYPSEMLNDVDPKGLYDLRLEISKYLEIYRGMKVDANQIIIGSGSTSLISMLVELLGRNKHYAMENPGYQKIKKLFIGNGVKLSFIDLDYLGLDVKKLESSHAEIIHITPSHQFPSGIIMPIQRRIELLNWANKDENRFIIEDDYDSEFRYSGKPIPALQGLDHQEKIIYMNTFSKTLSPSFRMSYVVLPKKLMNIYHELSSYHACTVPLLEQYILAAFMKQGSFERHINRMKNLYKQKVEIVIHEVNKHKEFHLANFEAGLHAVLEIYTKMPEAELISLLKNEKIMISGLSDFFVGKLLWSYPVLILGYSGIPLSDLKKNIEHLIQTIKKITPEGY